MRPYFLRFPIGGDLFVSMPVFLVSENLAVPSTNRVIILAGAATPPEGSVIFHRTLTTASGAERLLRSTAAKRAAKALEAEISKLEKHRVTVSLEGEIVHRYIVRSQPEVDQPVSLHEGFPAYSPGIHPQYRRQPYTRRRVGEPFFTQD